MMRFANPILLKIKACASLCEPTVWLPKRRLVVLKLSSGTGTAKPAPLRATRLATASASSALLLIVIAPPRAPSPRGVKLTLTAQLTVGIKKSGASGQLLLKP